MVQEEEASAVASPAERPINGKVRVRARRAGCWACTATGRRRHKLAKKPQMKDKLIYITTEEGEKFISFVEKYWIDWHDR